MQLGSSVPRQSQCRKEPYEIIIFVRELWVDSALSGCLILNRTRVKCLKWPRFYIN